MFLGKAKHQIAWSLSIIRYQDTQISDQDEYAWQWQAAKSYCVLTKFRNFISLGPSISILIRLFHNMFRGWSHKTFWVLIYSPYIESYIFSQCKK